MVAHSQRQGILSGDENRAPADAARYARAGCRGPGWARPLTYEHSESGQAELRIFQALASRRFHGQNSDHECENSGHGLLKAFIKLELFDTATFRPSRCGVEE